jgi:hypothetical protein
MEAIKAAFDAYFAPWGITLPDDALMARSPGVLAGQGWRIRYRFGQDGAGEHLEFYATHRMTNDRHVRIAPDGGVEHLDALWDAYAYDPEVPGDRERAERAYLEHNRRVAAELKEKWPDEEG